MKSMIAFVGILIGAAASAPALAGGHWGYAHTGGVYVAPPRISFGIGIGFGPYWPWYYPPAYYYPPPYYYPPAYYYYPPPPPPPPPAPAPAPPLAAPNSSGTGAVQQPPTHTATAQQAGAASQAPARQLFMYPQKGQSEQQEAVDRDQCYQWAMSQIGYDPSRPSGALTAAQTNDYYRAMEACLDARGYSVR